MGETPNPMFLRLKWLLELIAGVNQECADDPWRFEGRVWVESTMRAVFPHQFCFARCSIAIVLALLVCSSFSLGADTKVHLPAGEVTKRLAEGSTKMTYHVAMPKEQPESGRAPLLILFSPGGDGKRILEPVAPAANRYGWIAVGVDKLRNGAMDTRLMQRMEDQVLDDILRVIPHDSERIYLGGLSGGAMRAFSLTVRRKKDGFAGVLSMGGWLGGTQYARRDYPKGLAVAMIAGDKDEGAHQWSRHDAAVFTRLGGRVQMFVFPGGHQMAPTGIIRQSIKWFDKDWRTYH